jgi:hypothetical protein
MGPLHPKCNSEAVLVISVQITTCTCVESTRHIPWTPQVFCALSRDLSVILGMISVMSWKVHSRSTRLGADIRQVITPVTSVRRLVNLNSK